MRSILTHFFMALTNWMPSPRYSVSGYPAPSRRPSGAAAIQRTARKSRNRRRARRA
ncbi:hypothetical protein R0381_003632 [Jeongeupia wiesaeckerbachi]|uniref:hypothetical protein n=1 Tax=Jeongeupia wiesaeckerbachi TaxID=3051218 RepID=UPI003D806218